MQDTVVLDGYCQLLITENGQPELDLAEDGEFGSFTTIHVVDWPYYTGPTEVTPAAEAQILSTEDTIVSTDITINPIPSNYGLITWDGSVLTVS